jgi:LPXTG-motif cell wall-anchored protein
LPKTGLGEASTSNNWYALIIIGALGSLSLLYVINRKRSN